VLTRLSVFQQAYPVSFPVVSESQPSTRRLTIVGPSAIAYTRSPGCHESVPLWAFLPAATCAPIRRADDKALVPSDPAMQVVREINLQKKLFFGDLRQTQSLPCVAGISAVKHNTHPPVTKMCPRFVCASPPDSATPGSLLASCHDTPLSRLT
jgi:hypothetical protein